MTRHAMVMEINRNIYMFIVSRYPWLSEVPQTWPLIVNFLESYNPILSSKVIRWNFLVKELLNTILIGPVRIV